MSATHPLAKCAKEVHPGACKFPAMGTENGIFPDYDLLARMKKRAQISAPAWGGVGEGGKNPTWSVSHLQAPEMLEKPVL